MSSLRRQLVRAIPDWPRARYNVFTGTNRWREWFSAWRALLSSRHDDEAVIREYEQAFASAVGCRHAISFGAGRMGLYAMLEALQLSAGDEIIIPAFTCVVVPNAMIYRGIRPVYVDIDPVTFNMDPAGIEAAITRRTRALYLQHTFGVSADVEAITEIANRHGLPVIEDAAHSLGANHAGQPHGSLGQVAFFSTDRTKVINTLLGGMVTTNDDRVATRLAALQADSPFLEPSRVRRILFAFIAEFVLYSPPVLWIGRPLMAVLRRMGLLFYWQDELLRDLPQDYPYPCRLSSSQADLGSSQLADLARNLAHRRSIARWLEDRIGWYGDSAAGGFEDQTWLRYSFLVRDRYAFEKKFGNRFDLGVWFTSIIYGRERDLHEVGYESGSCPVAETVAKHIVNFPTHRRISLRRLAGLWSKHESWCRSQIVRLPELVP